MRYRRFITYLTVGLSSYLIEMGTLYILKFVFQASDLLAVAISFWVGFAVAFILQKWVTFRSHDKRPKTITKQVLVYSLLAGWNYVFTLILVALLSHSLSVFIVRTLAIAIITIWNYAIYRTIIFKNTQGDDNGHTA
jgi:putative flippase GtrA